MSKARWMKVVSVLLVVLLVVACSADPAASSQSSASDFSSAPRLTSEGSAPGVDLTGPFFLSLTTGDPTAYLNGNAVPVTDVPLTIDNILYIPLEQVVLLLGGHFTQEEDTVTVELAQLIAQYTLGSRELVLDGIHYQAHGGTDAESQVPVLIDGVFYVPAEFTAGLSHAYPLNTAQLTPEGLTVFYSNYDFQQELTVNGIALGSCFEELSPEQKQMFGSVGIVYTNEELGYQIEGYTCDGMELYVIRVPEGQTGMESDDGTVGAIHVTGYQFPTARGLVVTDTPYTAWRLYGGEGFTNHFQYRVDNGRVASYTFYSRYYGSNL